MVYSNASELYEIYYGTILFEKPQFHIKLKFWFYI